MNEQDCKAAQAVNSIPSALFTWGSFQYDSAAKLYMELLKDELCYGRDKTFVKHNIKVGKIQPFAGKVLEKFKETVASGLTDWAADGEDVTGEQVELEGVKTVTETLHCLRDQAWDLWSAANYIAPLVFPELDAGREIVSDTNGFTSVICWLLKSYGYVENEEPFEGWDT